ncbi:MAG: hypothetical protein IPK50_16705 [Fibrobacterota bacterium]|nr:MAG: hypothetical protein IPK50_16705 [Fibrobacterota bacterium]
MRTLTRLFVLCAVLALPSVSFAATGDGSPTDPNLVYVGRWDKSNPSQPRSHWGGAYIRAEFTGSSLSVKLGQRVDLAVFIDSKPVSMKMGANGVVSLATGLGVVTTPSRWSRVSNPIKSFSKVSRWHRVGPPCLPPKPKP